MLGGAAIAARSGVNVTVARSTEGPVHAAPISFAVGTRALGLIAPSRRDPLPARDAFAVILGGHGSAGSSAHST